MHPVGISVRMRILGVLGDGPMTLVRLLSSIQSDRAPSRRPSWRWRVRTCSNSIS